MAYFDFLLRPISRLVVAVLAGQVNETEPVRVMIFKTVSFDMFSGNYLRGDVVFAPVLQCGIFAADGSQGCGGGRKSMDPVISYYPEELSSIWSANGLAFVN